MNVLSIQGTRSAGISAAIFFLVVLAAILISALIRHVLHVYGGLSREDIRADALIAALIISVAAFFFGERTDDKIDACCWVGAIRNLLRLKREAHSSRIVGSKACATARPCRVLARLKFDLSYAVESSQPVQVLAGRLLPPRSLLASRSPCLFPRESVLP